jgi:acylphosphatase
MKQIHLIIIGHVQGVGYRNLATRIALKLGLKGWMRNLDDGSVEAVVQGSNEKIDEFLLWCNRGPPKARVDEMHITEENPVQDLENFRIKR